MQSTPNDWPHDGVPRLAAREGFRRWLSRFCERGHHAGMAVLFLAAVGRLFLVQGASLGGLLLFFGPPLFAYIYLVAPDGWVWTRRLAGSFFVSVAIGILLAPMHRILPRLNGFPNLPLTDNRLLSWYVCVYLAYLVGVLPPYVAVRNLWLRSHEKPADFSRPTCWLILFAWSLLMLALGGGARQLFDIMFPAMILLGMLP